MYTLSLILRWILLKSRRFSQRTVKWHLLGHSREPPKEIIAKSLLHSQAVMRVPLSFRPLKIWNELSSVDGFLNLDSIENKNLCFISPVENNLSSMQL